MHCIINIIFETVIVPRGDCEQCIIYDTMKQSESVSSKVGKPFMQIEIISGFLGAGKTTFLNQYLKALAGEHTVVIENEFGSVGLDGSLIQSDTPVHELSSGCI